MRRNILFTKQGCEKCAELEAQFGGCLAGFERFDVETAEGIVELCSYDLFADAEQNLPIIVCGDRVARGYIGCKQLMESDKWQNIKLGD